MAAENDNNEVLVEGPRYAMLTRAQYESHIQPEWFKPQWWGGTAEPVSSGGRGSAWFIRHDTDDWVLRHYSRGGLAAKVSQRSYGYLGASKVRSFAEFRLLNHLFELGLPVPKPIAAWYERNARLSYHAAIIVQTIPDAKPFADCLTDNNSRLWRDLGQLLRRFHDAGVDHPDLNCHNVLVSEGRLFLIDFDKGQLRDPNGSRTWAEKNLERFWRSVRKLGMDPPDEVRDDFDRAYYRICF